MTIEHEVVQKLRELPPDKQQQVLDLVNSLTQNDDESAPLRNLRGLWKDLNFDITEEDIAQARREMWGNFPRNFS